MPGRLVFMGGEEKEPNLLSYSYKYIKNEAEAIVWTAIEKSGKNHELGKTFNNETFFAILKFLRQINNRDMYRILTERLNDIYQEYVLDVDHHSFDAGKFLDVIYLHIQLNPNADELIRKSGKFLICTLTSYFVYEITNETLEAFDLRKTSKDKDCKGKFLNLR